MSLLTQADLDDMKTAAMQCQSQDDYIRAIETNVIARLATVSVEPVAVTGGGKTYQDVEWVDNPPQLQNGTLLYTAEALAAARVQGIEQVVDAVIALLKGIDSCETDTDDGWWETSYQADFGKQKLDAIRALIGGKE